MSNVVVKIVTKFRHYFSDETKTSFLASAAQCYSPNATLMKFSEKTRRLHIPSETRIVAFL